MRLVWEEEFFQHKCLQLTSVFIMLELPSCCCTLPWTMCHQSPEKLTSRTVLNSGEKQSWIVLLTFRGLLLSWFIALLENFCCYFKNQISKDSAAKQAEYYIVEQSDCESSLCWWLISHVNTFILLPGDFLFFSLPSWNLEIKFYSCQVFTYSSEASQDGLTTSSVNL